MVAQSQLEEYLMSAESSLPDRRGAGLRPQATWQSRLSWGMSVFEDRIVVKIGGGEDFEHDHVLCHLRTALGESRIRIGDVAAVQALQETLTARGACVATAESCTGGLLSKMLTDRPGSSTIFQGGCVTYSDQSKQTLVGVNPHVINVYGAVSQETVREMAKGAARVFKADYGIAISGIAGPGGATPEKPLGTVWISIAHKDGSTTSRCFHLSGPRTVVRNKAAIAALVLADRFIVKKDGLDITLNW